MRPPKPTRRAEIARSGPSIGLPQDVFDVARSSQPEVLGDRSVSSAPPVAAIVPVLAGSPEIAGPLQRRIMQALSSLPPSSVPDVEVRDLKTEIMISLTDRYDTGMFAVASPRPTKELVAVMDRIAPILAETEGAVTIRGHTDGRMFRLHGQRQLEAFHGARPNGPLYVTARWLAGASRQAT